MKRLMHNFNQSCRIVSIEGGPFCVSKNVLVLELYQEKRVVAGKLVNCIVSVVLAGKVFYHVKRNQW